MLIQRHPQLLTLSVAQALYWSCSIIGIALTALVGQRLAPWPWMATVPLTLLVAVATVVVARWDNALDRARLAAVLDGHVVDPVAPPHPTRPMGH